MDKPASYAAHGSRVEDLRLIAGSGQYAADWNTPDQLYAHFLRSDRAHAEIVALDPSQTLAHPGVRPVLTGDDAMRAGYTNAPHSFNYPGRNGCPRK